MPALRPGRQKKFIIKRDAKEYVSSNAPKLNNKAPEEFFTGQVRGLKAAAAEERVARALDMLNVEYYFRFGTAGGRGAPGWKEIDFLFPLHGKHYPVDLVEKTFIHRGTDTHDKMNEAIIMDQLKKGGYNPQPFMEWDNALFTTQKGTDEFIRNFVREGLK